MSKCVSIIVYVHVLLDNNKKHLTLIIDFIDAH